MAPKEENPIVCAKESGEPAGEVVEADILSINVVETGLQVLARGMVRAC